MTRSSKICFWLSLSIVLFVLTLSPNCARSASSGLLINEVYYDTTGTDSLEEWFELYNATDTPIDLENYTFKSGSEEYVVKGELVISPKEFLIFAKDVNGFKALYEQSPDHIYSDISFSNTGDYLAVYDELDTLVDAVVWETGELTGTVAHSGASTGESLERKFLGVDTDDCSVDFEVVTNSAPWAKYIPPVYSNMVKITELVPDPEEGSGLEFIELFNGDDKPVELSGWLLDDIAEGGSNAYTISKDVVIEPGEYLVFYNTVTKISLNNDGDSVRLIDPNGRVVAVNYTKAEKNQSYSLIEEDWLWSIRSTPNAPNEYVLAQLPEVDLEKESDADENSPLLSIQEARQEEIRSFVSVEGKVTVTPGILSTTYFYIEDSTGGIQIYFHDRDFPSIQVGDFIQVRGELSESNNERRIKVSKKEDITILERTGEDVKPLVVEIAEIDEGEEGRFIEIIGEVSQTSGNIFKVISSNGQSEIKVVIRETTEIDKPKMKKGDKVKVAGIVSQYKEEYRILPISQENVIVLTSGDLPRAGPSEVFFMIILIAGVFWITLPIIWQKPIKSLPTLRRA